MLWHINETLSNTENSNKFIRVHVSFSLYTYKSINCKCLRDQFRSFNNINQPFNILHVNICNTRPLVYDQHAHPQCQTYNSHCCYTKCIEYAGLSTTINQSADILFPFLFFFSFTHKEHGRTHLYVSAWSLTINVICVSAVCSPQSSVYIFNGILTQIFGPFDIILLDIKGHKTQNDTQKS